MEVGIVVVVVVMVEEVLDEIEVVKHFLISLGIGSPLITPSKIRMIPPSPVIGVGVGVSPSLAVVANSIDLAMQGLLNP